MSDPSAAPPGPKLLDRVRIALRTRHYSPRTEEAYVGWSRRYILFHRIRHPAEMGPAEIAAFVSHLAVEEHVSASTQNQALSAVLFLYREVVGRPIGRVDGIVHAKRPKTLPVVLTRDEIRALLAKLHGTSWLVTWLLSLAPQARRDPPPMSPVSRPYGKRLTRTGTPHALPNASRACSARSSCSSRITL